MAGNRPSSEERSVKSEAIHTNLDQAAALINSVHARVLAEVIEAQAWRIHREVDGYSAVRAWLVAKFDFTDKTAADIAAIARTAKKFTHLTETAVSGRARIDAVAAAARRLEQTKAMRDYATAPYGEPVPSPFNPEIRCASPEVLIAQYCAHTSVQAVHALLDQIQAALDSGEEVLDGLAEQSLQRLDLAPVGNGMWDLRATLTGETGQMLAKALNTAVPPPRQDETDQTTGLLPPAANRRAEALHQILAVYGADPKAHTRHGHTTGLHLTVDIDTLRGEDTGRVPLLEGTPISLAKARLLACDAGIIVPSVFDYTTGEAVELGRAERLPTTALRRKLELEQPYGCAWHGCDAPLAWTEAHHIRHWADGGETVAENLILLCRFHHGRLHTPGWTITKTGPGKALIVHHDRHDDTDPDLKCGCADWRTAEDLDTEFAADVANVFPTGLYPDEWGPALRDELDRWAQHIGLDRDMKAAREARAKARARFRNDTGQPKPTPPQAREPEPSPAPTTPPPCREPETASRTVPAPTPATPAASMPPPGIKGERDSAHEPIPFLDRPSREGSCGGGRDTTSQPEPTNRLGPFPMPIPPNRTHRPGHEHTPRPPHYLFVAAKTPPPSSGPQPEDTCTTGFLPRCRRLMTWPYTPPATECLPPPGRAEPALARRRPQTGRSPVHRGRTGSEHQLATDANGRRWR
ncbi:HNH endonuclease signature motif containing protein [Glycomyces halotolerans]